MARAEADLRALIEQLRASGTDAATQDASQQLVTIQGLRQQVATAGLLALISLQSAVAGSVASATAAVAQGQSAVTQAAAAAELAKADAEARKATSSFVDDYFNKRIFDHDLRFASKEEEEAYRERERERQEAIARAQAKGTPQGDLEATKLSLAQLRDAGAHGAASDPQYAPMLHKLEASQDRLTTAIAENTPQPDKGAERLAASADNQQVSKAAAEIDPAVLAVFAKGVAPTDPSAVGHGVTGTVAKAGGSLPPLG